MKTFSNTFSFWNDFRTDREKIFVFLKPPFPEGGFVFLENDFQLARNFSDAERISS